MDPDRDRQTHGARSVLALALALALTVGGCTHASESEAPPATGPGAEPGAEPGSGPEPALVVEADTPLPADTSAEGPAPEPESEPEFATFEPVTRGDPSCRVTIASLHEAEEYRGPGPMTPAVEASLAADPDYAQMYNAESHGDHHIQCHYEVHLAHRPGERFTWRVVHNNTLQDRSPEICKGELAAVADDIIRTTRQCTDFAAGAYYGYVLERF